MKQQQFSDADKAKAYASMVEAYQQVFSSEAGKLVLENLKATHGFHQCLFRKDVNALELAFREGERNVVLRIMSFVQVDLKQLHDQITERTAQNDQASQ